MSDEEVNYSVPFFIADMKKPDGTDFPPTTLRQIVLQLQKFLELQGRRVKFLTDGSFMLMVSAVLHYVVTAQHCMQRGLATRNLSVCLCLSVCQMRGL